MGDIGDILEMIVGAIVGITVVYAIYKLVKGIENIHIPSPHIKTPSSDDLKKAVDKAKKTLFPSSNYSNPSWANTNWNVGDQTISESNKYIDPNILEQIAKATTNNISYPASYSDCLDVTIDGKCVKKPKQNWNPKSVGAKPLKVKLNKEEIYNALHPAPNPTVPHYSPPVIRNPTLRYIAY